MMRCSSRIKQRPSPLPDTPSTIIAALPCSHQSRIWMNASLLEIPHPSSKRTVKLNAYLIKCIITDPPYPTLLARLLLLSSSRHSSCTHLPAFISPTVLQILSISTTSQPHLFQSVKPHVRGGEWSRVSKLCRGGCEAVVDGSGSRAWGEPRHTSMLCTTRKSGT
jgi:hypothetical protein